MTHGLWNLTLFHTIVVWLGVVVWEEKKMVRPLTRARWSRMLILLFIAENREIYSVRELAIIRMRTEIAA